MPDRRVRASGLALFTSLLLGQQSSALAQSLQAETQDASEDSLVLAMAVELLPGGGGQVSPSQASAADPDAPVAGDTPVALAAADVLSTPASAAPEAGAVPAVAPPPDPIAELVRAGLAARQAGNYAEAREHFTAALALDPARPDVLHLLGMTEAYAKDYPAALARLEAAQALVPEDVDILLDRARVLAWSGQLEQAGRLADQACAGHPEDGEAWDMRARVYWYQAQPELAEAAARKAVALDPPSTDFRLMLAQTLAAQGRYPEAADIAREIAPQRPQDPEVAALIQAETDNRPRPWRVDLALSHSSFERIPLQDWQGISLQLNRQLSKSDTVYGRIDAANRFDQNNTSLTVGDAHVFRPGFAGYAEATVTPGATFFPHWRVGGGGELRVREDSAPVGATFLAVDAAVAGYNAGTSYGVAPGVIQYFNGGRSWVSVHLNNSIDAYGHYLNGWGVRADTLLGTDWAVHAGWSRAPESDTEVSGGVIAVVRDLTLGASWQLSPDLSLRLDYLREDRVRSYIRHELMLGGSYRF